MEVIFELLYTELKQATRASESNCREVAGRLAEEVTRICQQSQRIQASGEVETWATALARHRLQQCLNYYNLGSRQGRVELHSTLSAIVYRYLTPLAAGSSYQARLSLIEDFLQSFYEEALKAFRREAHLSLKYRPQSLLELAEYMAFAERYGKRRIPLRGGRSQQLIILRAQSFSQQQPPETSVDMEQAAEGAGVESDQTWNDTSVQQVRSQMVSSEPEPMVEDLRTEVITELMIYLEENKQSDCADYFALRLKDLTTGEIESILGLTPRQRDYLQQRFKYHLIRFALRHRWELVHQWLEADLEKNLGLLPQQWQEWLAKMGAENKELIKLKQQGFADAAIAQKLGCTVNSVQKRWFKLLEQAWELRNRLVSGEGTSTDE
ncbi:MAG TPA: heterocyst differentiation protein HetZ [Halomicronema sp.]